MHFGFGSADFRMLDLNIGSLVAAPLVTRITDLLADREMSAKFCRDVQFGGLS